MVELAEVFVVTAAESDQDLVVPRPDPMVSRPACESAFLSIDHNMSERLRGLLSRCEERDRADPDQSHVQHLKICEIATARVG